MNVYIIQTCLEVYTRNCSYTVKCLIEARQLYFLFTYLQECHINITATFFPASKCDFNNAICAAHQNGEMLYTASYGACVDTSTSCGVMHHVTCMQPIHTLPAGPLDLVDFGPKRAVPIEITERVCGSDTYTYCK